MYGRGGRGGRGQGRGQGWGRGGGPGWGAGGWAGGPNWGAPVQPISGVPLLNIPAGSTVKIVSVLAGPNLWSRLHGMGLGIGSIAKVEANDYRGVILNVNGTKFALGRGMASKIFVVNV
ncbi:MAG: FeoA family protein [Candidatus Njordarchaeia archaeon]